MTESAQRPHPEAVDGADKARRRNIFSSFSPLGIGSGSDVSSPAGTATVSEASSLSLATPFFRAVPKVAPEPTASPAPTDAAPTPLPRQGAIPVLLPSWVPPTTATAASLPAEAADEQPGEPSEMGRLPSSVSAESLAYANHTRTASSAATDGSDCVSENHVLRHNVEVLKALALQLAAQLDLAQARLLLHEADSKSCEQLSTSAKTTTEGTVETHVAGSEAERLAQTHSREQSLLLLIEQKDDLINTLRAQLESQERWYESTLEERRRETNALLERFAPASATSSLS